MDESGKLIAIIGDEVSRIWIFNREVAMSPTESLGHFISSPIVSFSPASATFRCINYENVTQ